MRHQSGCISFRQLVYNMSVAGSYLRVPMPQHFLNQPQILGFLIQISAAAVTEHMAGAARIL